jgi:hypothetical protein
VKTVTSARMKLLLSLSCLAGLLFPVSQAQAGTRICRSRLTDSHDRDLLRAAMQQVMPPGVPSEGIPDVCRNPGSANAWMSTWARLRSDGVTEWWDIDCQRSKTQQWACESPVHRQLVWVYGEVGGILRRLEVSFDDASGLNRARLLAVRAMQIIQDPASAPISACGSRSSEDNRSEWEKAQHAYALTPQDRAIELSVESDEDGVVDVTRGGVGLGLRFTDGSGGTSSSRVCWAMWIVVT